MTVLDEKVLALARKLVRLDPRRGHKFLPRLLRQLTELFSTDRVSILLLDLRKQRFSRAVYSGFKVPREGYNESNLVSLQVVSRGVPLLSANIRRDNPDLVGPFADSYATNAFLSVPMILGEDVIGVISISNLSDTAAIDRALPNIELLTGIITQIVSVLELPAVESPRSAARQIREVREFSRILEELSDADKMVAAYTQAMYAHYDLVGIVVFADNLGKEELSWLSLATPTGRAECKSVVEKVWKIWRDKMKYPAHPAFEDVRIVDRSKLLDAELPVRTAAIKVFPLVLDQKVFGIVGVALESESEFSDEHLDLFNLLTFQFAMSLKNHLLDRKSLESEVHDRLTGLYTPQYFEKLFVKEFERSKRYNVQLVLLLVDIDHYKELSDTYGTRRANQVILEVSKILTANSRTSDVICRLGEDKYAALLPETSLKQAEMQAERIRNFVANHSFFSCETQVFIKASVSVGVASFRDHRPESAEQLIEFADTALYFAKRNGRNRAVSYSFVLNLFLKEGGG